MSKQDVGIANISCKRAGSTSQVDCSESQILVNVMTRLTARFATLCKTDARSGGDPKVV